MRKKIIVFSFILLFSSAALAVENKQSQTADTRFQQYNQKIPKQYEPLNDYVQPNLIYGYGGARRFGYENSFIDNASVNDYVQDYGQVAPFYNGYYPGGYVMVNPANGYRQYKRDNNPEAYVEHDTIVSPEEYNFIPLNKK